MKHFVLFLMLTGLVAGCKQDKQTRLDQLKSDLQNIQEEIQTLETELGTDTIGKKVRVTPVSVRSLVATSFEHFIEVQGVAYTDNNITLTAKSPGTVETVRVKEGDVVKKGQLLVQLDDQIIVNSISEVRTSLAFATEMYEKQKGLWDQKIGSEVQYLSAKNNKDALESKLATLREQLKMTKVVSPISGTVDQVNVRMGEMASPGIPLLRVVNLSDFEIKAAVAENYSSQVKNGTPVTVVFPDLKGEIQAEIHYTGKVVDPVDRTFNVVVRIEKPTLEIKPNMIAVVRIQDFREEQAIVVPVNTIQQSDEGKFVFIAENTEQGSVARMRAVQVGPNYNGVAMISEGLYENDQLITFGFQELSEGQPVQF